MNLNSEQILPEDFYLAEEGSLLEEMAEEDEEIDLYNEVTFGLDHEDSEDEMPKEECQSKPHDQKPSERVCEEMEAPGKQAQEVEDTGDTSSREVKTVTDSLKEVDRSVELEGHSESTSIDESRLEDPAVMKAIHGQPSLESVDSAVVDSGIGSTWTEHDTDYDLSGMDSGSWEASPKVRATIAGQLLEDRAILRVMDKAPYIPPANLEFLGSPMQRGYMCGQRLKVPEMGRLSPKPFRQRFIRQQSPLVSHPFRPPFPFTPPRRAAPPFAPDQSTGFMSHSPFRPMSPNISTPIRPMTPKMAGMHFGPMSPSPSMSPFFSPMGDTLQRFKFPGHVTQLHPQHRRILSQRQRTQSRKQWDSRPDPYASLMSQKEKDWVIKLQMIQLQSENPHLDDYYYQTYYGKLERRLAEEELIGERKKKEPPKLVTPYIQKAETYESVVHFEGSLGQVAVSTCYSPRRAIDAIPFVVPDEDIKVLGYQRLRMLKHIEKLFVKVIDVEEIERKMPLLPEEHHLRYQQKQSYKVQSIYEALRMRACSCEEESEDEFLQILQIGKGKKLIARLLPYLRSKQTVEILLIVVQHLSYLITNDTTEKTLPLLYGPLTSIITGLSFTELIRVIQELTRPLPDGSDMPLTLAFQNQFGISLLYALLSHGENLLSSDTPMEPCIGDFEKWTDTVFLVAKELSHVSKSCMVEPLFLPSNLLSLFCRYLDKQTIHKLEDKMECPAAPPFTAVPS